MLARFNPQRYVLQRSAFTAHHRHIFQFQQRSHALECSVSRASARNRSLPPVSRRKLVDQTAFFLPSKMSRKQGRKCRFEFSARDWAHENMGFLGTERGQSSGELRMGKWKCSVVPRNVAVKTTRQR